MGAFKSFPNRPCQSKYLKTLDNYFPIVGMLLAYVLAKGVFARRMFMKVNANKFQWVLGLAILAQVGCNGNNNLNRAGMYPQTNAAAEAHTTTGDAFGGQRGVGNDGNLANIINRLAQGSQNRTAVPVPAPEKDPAKNPTEEEGEVAELEGFTVDMSQANLWKDACVAVLNKMQEAAEKANEEYKVSDPTKYDANFKKIVFNKRKVESLPNTGDKDKIPDECETVLSNVDLAGDHFMGGLNPKVYNGAVVSAKRYVDEREGFLGTKKDPTDSFSSIRLTKEEKEAFKEDRKNRGGKGKGVFSKYERQLAQKYQAVKVLEGTDLMALRHIFQIVQRDKSGKSIKNDNRIRVHNNYKAVDRMPSFDMVSGKDFFAVVNGGDREAVPHSLMGMDVGSVSELTGLGKDIDGLRERDQILYVAETHLYVPGDGMSIRIGHLNKIVGGEEGKREAVTGTAQDGGLFIVLINGESEIVQTDLVSDHSLDFKGSAGGEVTATTGCKTTHLVIGYLAGTRDKAKQDEAIFAENVFYREGTDEEWKPLRQDMMSVQPIPDKNNQAGETCSFEEKNVFFQEAKTILSTPSDQVLAGGNATVNGANSQGPGGAATTTTPAGALGGNS